MVQILMATYNGAKYIQDQIESIINQTYQNWELLIHDDGSTDGTVNIINQISKKDSRIKLLLDNIHFGNAGRNFMYLVSKANAEYIMFSDQDDIWSPDKIYLMKNQIQQEQSNTIMPTVVYSAADAWDGKNKLFTLYNKPESINNVLFNNCGIQGASSIFNKKMLLMMKKWNGSISMHDHLLMLLGYYCGSIGYCSDVLMKYRKHPEAVTFNSRNKGIIKNLYLGRHDPVLDTNHFNTIKKFYKIYYNNIQNSQRIKLKEFLTLPDKSFFERLRIIKKNSFSIRNSTLVLYIKMILRPFCETKIKNQNFKL